MSTIKDYKKDEVSSKALVNLEENEIAEIEETFKSATDFRSLGEKITEPLNTIISDTTKVIDKDPIMNVSNELEKMNGEVQSVYSEIIDNDGGLMKFFKSLPVVGGVAKTLDKKWDAASFNMKSIEGKINVIFNGFDQSLDSLNSSINIQKNFIDGIEGSLGKVMLYKEHIGKKIEEFKTRLEETIDEDEKMKLEMFLRNVEFFQGNLVVLIGNLDMAKKRLLMKLDSSTKLSLAMSSSRPIFKVLLTSAVAETSTQKALDASMKAMDIMGKTIDQMSSDLTDKTIEASKRAESISSKPVLSSSVFIENVSKLKNHFEEIDDYRLRIKEESEKERKIFAEAKANLDDIKILNKSSQEELSKKLLEN